MHQSWAAIDAQAQDGARARQPANGSRARLSDILVTSGFCTRRCEQDCAPAESTAWGENSCCLRPLSLIGPCQPPPPQSGGRPSVCVAVRNSAWSEISEARPHQPTTQLKCVLGQTQPVNPYRCEPWRAAVHPFLPSSSLLPLPTFLALALALAVLSGLTCFLCQTPHGHLFSLPALA